MNQLHEILYATIKNFELEQRMQRHDMTFDAFAHLSKMIGHKNASTLRKMCEPREGHTAKLGVDEAILIMAETGDYRLYAFIKQQLEAQRVARQAEGIQLGLFAQPLRNIGGGR